MSSTNQINLDQDLPLHQQLRRGYEGGGNLRAASPAVKRPASDMGAQEREEHLQDAEMESSSTTSQTPASEGLEPCVSESTSKAKQQDTGSRHSRSESSETIASASDPRAHSQKAPSNDTSSSESRMSSSVSTAPTSVMTTTSTPSLTLPSIDEQVVRVQAMIERSPQDKQKGYIISQKWLDRVLSRSSHGPALGKVDKEAIDGAIGPIDNSDLVMIMEGSGELQDEVGEPFVPLKPNAQMGDDYQVLPQEAWDLVVSWYGVHPASPTITRYAHNTATGLGQENIQYELNPPVISILKLPAESGPTTQSIKERDLPPFKILSSRSTPLFKWLKTVKTDIGIDTKTRVRLWRVLGGLKSAGGSGMLTPAASRSASPAPGALITASAGDKLVLDVNTFISLSDGSERELLDVKDATVNEKYNGSQDLGIAGIIGDMVIVLEEQIGGPGGGEWPSDSLKSSSGRLNVPKTTAAERAKIKSTSNGRASPAPGMMTRGRQKRDGRPKGIVGLANMGNTCYMNSALQCLRSVEELTQYFLQQKYKAELNPSNPLSHNGDVAKAYGALLDQIYGQNSIVSSVTPRHFKTVIGKYGPNFSGYGQQDSQEFLLFLLDGLQEDLNRVHKKPYIEKPDSTDDMVRNPALLREMADKCWDIYLARNSSVISDLFAGMYKSTLHCPVCDKVSIIFDPFNNLTLQLPIENNWSKEIFYFPLHKRPIRIDVDIDKNASFKGLKEFVAKRMQSDPDRLIMAEIYKNRFYKMFDNKSVITEAGIQPADELGIFEVETTPTNYDANKAPKKFSYLTTTTDDDVPDYDSPGGDQMLIPVFNRCKRSSSIRQKQFFGVANYIILSRDEAKDENLVLKKLLANVATMTTKPILDEAASSSAVETAEDSDTVVMNHEDGMSSDSNQVHAHSVQGEDGLVDVSMPDAEATSPENGESSGLHEALRPNSMVPPMLQNLFSIHYVSTSEVIPTGANNIDELKEYPSILNRRRKPAGQQRPSRTIHHPSPSRSSSASSEDEGSIPARRPKSDSFIRDSDDSDYLGGDKSDGSLPSPDELLSSSRSSSRRNSKAIVTYSRKNKSSFKNHTEEYLQESTHPLVRPGEALVLDWSADAHEALFEGTEGDDEEMRGAATWTCVEMYRDDELTAKRALRSSRRKKGVSLNDCLDEFGKSEILSENDAWYCPRCKEHRRASKKFELWKAPDILVMHLKRFSSNRNFRDKLEVLVDYPVEGLDLSERVIMHEEDKSLVYDLIAVDNHYGGLGGGHYTAYARNFFDKGWYEYNDAHSSKRNPQAVVSAAAYLLFYRRRSERPLGGPQLEQIIEDADNDGQADSDSRPPSRAESPVAGEGQRLDDSSRNGSSSASAAAGATHLAGDGGVVHQRRIPGAFLDDDLVQGPELPPSYGSTLGRGQMNMGGMDEDEGFEDAPNYSTAPLNTSSANLAHYQDQPQWSFGSLNTDPNPIKTSLYGPPRLSLDPKADFHEGPEENLYEPQNNDDMDDAASTKVEGMNGSSDAGSDAANRLNRDFGSDDSLAQLGMVTERRHRESAPAPDAEMVTPDVGPDDDEDEMPVHEIKVDDEGFSS